MGTVHSCKGFLTQAGGNEQLPLHVEQSVLDSQAPRDSTKRSLRLRAAAPVASPYALENPLNKQISFKFSRNTPTINNR
jgi:hypothetical protein